MGEYKKVVRGPASPEHVLLRLQNVSDPAISEYVEKLRACYKKYALPPEETRRIIDKSMGDKPLTEVLYRMREEEF